MPRIVEKVTAFVTRPSPTGPDLLLFRHPNAGIQIPAGTVEDDETPEAAVLREAAEETGLASLSVQRYLGHRDEPPAAGYRLAVEPTAVYSRPDPASFDWAHLRKGIPVKVNRVANGYTHVTYEEFDRVPDPQYVTLCIIGWVPDRALTGKRTRHFFHLQLEGSSEESWTVHIDNHMFTLFWASIDNLPEIIYPQNEWLEFFDRNIE